jgi:apolipoprotein D and lipocalin family protein
MTASTRRSLSAEISAQEQAVEAADQRLTKAIRAIRARAQPRGAPLRGLALSAGSMVAAWLFVRSRRPAAVSAAPRDRLAAILNAALPLLVPVIGVRAAAVLTALAALPSASPARVPAVAQGVDLSRYVGTWFEIARLPTPYQRQCAQDVTATYQIDGAGLRVINRCRRRNGSVAEVRGRARVADPVSQAKLRVSFAPAFRRWLPFVWADYWILDVSPNYGLALVGTPDLRALWVLAREPSVPDASYRALLMHAAAQGYDTNRMRVTPHRMR